MVRIFKVKKATRRFSYLASIGMLNASDEKLELGLGIKGSHLE